jgi:hypothetical protein
MSDDLATLEPHKYDKFRHTNGVAYAFLEVPVDFLNQQMPDYANWAVEEVDEEGNPIEIKTLGEYTIGQVLSIDGTKVVITLAAMQAATYRTPAITYDDMQDWEDWLGLHGYTIDDWLTIADRNTLLASEAYGLGDE